MTDEWKAGTGQKVLRLYAWIADEGDGEGIVGVDLPTLGFQPLIGADRARIESFRAYAESIAAQTGRPIFLKVFGSGTVIDQV